MNRNWFLIGIVVFFIGGTFLFFSFSHNVYSIVNTFFSQKEIGSSLEVLENENNKESISEEKINFTLYYDFSCPYCKKFYNNTFKPLQKKYKENFDFQIIPYAVNLDSKSFEQVKWFVCLSDNQGGNIVKNDIIEKIDATSELSSVSQVFSFSDEKNKKFQECVESEETLQYSLNLRKQARSMGVRGTPTFFIGNEKFERNQSLKKVELKIIEILQK